MRTMLRNLSIRAKVLTIPLALTVFLVGLGVYAFVLLNGNEIRVRELSDSVLRQTVVAFDFSDETEKSLSRLYRLTSVAANESDAKKLEALAKAALQDTTKYAAKLPALKAALAEAGIPAAQVGAFEGAFSAYIKAAKNVIEMADGDAGTAMAFMSGTQRKFVDVSKLLDEILATLAAARDRRLEQIYADMADGRAIFATAIGIVVLVALTLAFFISRLISVPIVTMAGAVARIAAKDYAVPVPALGQKDELGKMAGAVDVLKQHSVDADRLADEQKRSHESDAERRRALEAAITEFDSAVRSIVDSVSSAATEMKASSQAMSGTAEHVSRQSTAVATAAEEASANVQTVAAASEQLSASIVEIGRQASNSTRIAGKAVVDANGTDAKVQSLAQAAQKIGDVVKLIN
ncbi:MAG: HAMP domain-containing protein, partial [Proteobacteria bacterium]|nr:HAMP domain-containing protein [Pseudomonadota bacterium]